MHVLSCQLTTFQVDDMCTVGIKSYFIFRPLQAAYWLVEKLKIIYLLLFYTTFYLWAKVTDKNSLKLTARKG